MANRNKKHVIEIVSRPRSVPAAALRSIGAAVLERLLTRGARITLAFIDDEQMRALNARFRGNDATTDVLSFPIGDETSDGGVYLGDIAISVDQARRQAQESGCSMRTEILQLFAHGLIHLCGYDHDHDAGEMDALEMQIRREIVDQYC